MDLYLYSRLWDGILAMNELSLRISGFISSLTLTILAYFIILYSEYFSLTNKEAILVIFTLGVTQSLVQLIFFIDVWNEKKTYWNLAIFISTVSIIFVVVFFSIWIMNHLNYHMH